MRNSWMRERERGGGGGGGGEEKKRKKKKKKEERPCVRFISAGEPERAENEVLSLF